MVKQILLIPDSTLFAPTIEVHAKDNLLPSPQVICLRALSKAMSRTGQKPQGIKAPG